MRYQIQCSTASSAIAGLQNQYGWMSKVVRPSLLGERKGFTWCHPIDLFTTLCTVSSDTSRILNTLKPKRGKDGKKYYELQYDVVFLFGLTELEAQVSWRNRVCRLAKKFESWSSLVNQII